jgi:hypothetical protein
MTLLGSRTFDGRVAGLRYGRAGEVITRCRPGTNRLSSTSRATTGAGLS